MRATWIILAALAILFTAMVLMPGEAKAESENSHKPTSIGDPSGPASGAILITVGPGGTINFYWDLDDGQNGPWVIITLRDGTIVYGGSLAH